MTKQIHKSRDERKLEILQMARAAAKASINEPMPTKNPAYPVLITPKTHWTTGNMARWLNLSVSTKFRNMLYELSSEGYLTCVFVKYPGGGVCSDKAVFCLPEFNFTQLAFDF